MPNFKVGDTVYMPIKIEFIHGDGFYRCESNLNCLYQVHEKEIISILDIGKEFVANRFEQEVYDPILPFPEKIASINITYK